MDHGRHIAGIALALALPLTAAAEITWDYVDVRYLAYDATGASGDGFGITGVKSIGNSAYVLGAYDDVSFDVAAIDASAAYWRVGIGTHRTLSESIVGFSEFTYENASVELGALSADDNGFGFRLGLRGMVSDALELNGGIRYVDTGASDTLLGVGAVFTLGDRFGLVASYEDGDDSFYTVGARLTF